MFKDGQLTTYSISITANVMSKFFYYDWYNIIYGAVSSLNIEYIYVDHTWLKYDLIG